MIRALCVFVAVLGLWPEHHTHALTGAQNVAGDAHFLPPGRCSSFARPELVSPMALCPSECPYSQPFGCQKVCVIADDCAILSPSHPFPDESSFTCRPPCGDTPIPGCAVCASPGVCKECAVGPFGFSWLELTEGGTVCKNSAEKSWRIVYAILIGLALVPIGYGIHLWSRPAINTKGYENAMVQRRNKTHLGGDHGYWGPSVDDDLAGRGIPLYFTGLAVTALFVTVTGVIAYYANPEEWRGVGAGCDPQSLAAGFDPANDPGGEGDVQPWVEKVTASAKAVWGPDIETLPDQHHHAPHRMLLYAFLYLFSTISALVLYAWKRAPRDAMHQDFTLRISNIPKDLTDPTLLQSWIRTNTKTTCVGVSICYDFAKHADDITAALGDVYVANDISSDVNRSTGCQRGTMTEESLLVAPLLDGAPAAPGSFLDSPIMSCVGVRERVPEPILCSGYAFAIFASRHEADEACQKINGRVVVPFLASSGTKGNRLKAQKSTCEPKEVFWTNYSRAFFWHKIAFGILLLILTMFVWLLLSLPYALFFANQIMTPSLEHSGFSKEVILGLLIAGGNGLLSVVIERVADWSGFHEKGNRDLAVLGLAFGGSLVNTLFDLICVVVIAKGASLNAAFEGAEEGYPRVLAHEMFRLIVPGYLFVPLLVEPLFDRVLHYYLSAWLVRSRNRINQLDANTVLQHKPFEISWRYAMVLTNITVCLFLLFLPSGDAWRVMVALFFCIVVTFAIDRYILLHGSQRTPYWTHSLNLAFIWGWMLPTGVLAVVTTFWAVHANFLTSWWSCLIVFGGHCLIFTAILLLLSPTREIHEESYESVTARLPDTYFTENPVHQLRARLLGPQDDYFKA